MALRQGTLTQYNNGCRCADCVERNSSYRQQRRSDLSVPDIAAGQELGRVELAVIEEIGFAVQARPGLAAIARQLEALLDNPRATSQHAAAAKVLSVRY